MCHTCVSYSYEREMMTFSLLMHIAKTGNSYLNKREENFENLFLYKDGELRRVGKQLHTDVTVAW